MNEAQMIYQLNDEYYVRPLVEADIAGPYPGWFEDQEVCRFNSHGKFFRTESWFRDYIASINGIDKIVWAISHKVDGHIGNISLQDISGINRSAEFAILLGDKRHWGKSVGLLAGRQLLEHGFRKLDLVRVYCGTAATNEGMKRLAERLGMRLEGTRRQQLFLDGQRVDLVEYGILRDEFTEGESASAS
jgi:[ribosomal protein S5]-alanine N-acetyltransferase